MTIMVLVVGRTPSWPTPTVVKTRQKELQPSRPAQTPALLLAMVKRLATAEWFTAKVSAAGILPAIYRYFTALHNARVAAGLVEEGGGETDGDDVVGGTGSGPRPSDAHREL